MSTYPGVDINKITERNYIALFEQSFNMINARLNGKIEHETERDKRKRLKEEFRKLMNG